MMRLPLFTLPSRRCLWRGRDAPAGVQGDRQSRDRDCQVAVPGQGHQGAHGGLLLRDGRGALGLDFLSLALTLGLLGLLGLWAGLGLLGL